MRGERDNFSRMDGAPFLTKFTGGEIYPMRDDIEPPK